MRLTLLQTTLISVGTHRSCRQHWAGSHGCIDVHRVKIGAMCALCTSACAVLHRAQRGALTRECLCLTEQPKGSVRAQLLCACALQRLGERNIQTQDLSLISAPDGDTPDILFEVNMWSTVQQTRGVCSHMTKCIISLIELWLDNWPGYHLEQREASLTFLEHSPQKLNSSTSVAQRSCWANYTEKQKGAKDTLLETCC